MPDNNVRIYKMPHFAKDLSCGIVYICECSVYVCRSRWDERQPAMYIKYSWHDVLLLYNNKYTITI